MRKYDPQVVLALVVLTAATSGFAEELPSAKPADVGLSAKKLEAVRTAVNQAIEKKQSAGVVVLIGRKGKVAYVEAFGNRNIEQSVPMSADSLFRIYSMSKPITTVAAMTLVEEGKISLDDPVSKYLPELGGLRVHTGDGDKTIPSKRDMTIRDLMRHTSGLSYGMQPATPVDKLYAANRVTNSGDSLAQMVTKLGKLPLRAEPGTQFNYSVSTDVLGRLIEVVSKKTLDAYFQERIFTPLDMKDTGFFVSKENADRLASIYQNANSKLTSMDAGIGRYAKMPKFLSGGGGLVSSARDYSRFCQMILNGGELFGTRILKAETVREMSTNQLPQDSLPMTIVGYPMPGRGFGLGFAGPLPKDAKSTFEEFGWSGYASTDFWISPKRDTYVVIMQQVIPPSPLLQLTLHPIINGAVE